MDIFDSIFEGNDLVSIASVINNLSSESKLIDEDTDNLDAIMLCADFLNEYGIITYPNCRAMESFSKEDLERLANIMGTKLVYETDDFIATEAFLSNCSSVSPC